MSTKELKLRVHEESDLFSPLDPDQIQLSEDVISYLNRNYEILYRKNMYRKDKDDYIIHIFSDTPVNENHIKDAIRTHGLQEEEIIRFDTKIESVKELVLGILGLVILSLWYVLSSSSEGVYLEIMTIVGWVAIWEAASSALLRRPQLMHKKKAFDSALNAEIIIEVSPQDQT